MGANDIDYPGWAAVDSYFAATLVHEDAPLVEARRSSRQTTMPDAEIAPNQGKLLYLIAQMIGAHRVLEFGTLAGYSTIWLARAVGPSGQVVTLEADASNATIAAANLTAAGVADRVELIVGPAARSAAQLAATDVDPFDLFFIDADKARNSEYLAACLRFAHPGSVIVGDNVVRSGLVAHADTGDTRVDGIRSFLADLAAHPQLEATAIQTVGAKGWDGFALAVVRHAE